MLSQQPAPKPQHTIGETITGTWNHGRVGEAVNKLLSPQIAYLVIERLPNGDIVRTVRTTGVDIQRRCSYLLGTCTHIYEVTDASNSLVLRYKPGGNSANRTIH